MGEIEDIRRKKMEELIKRSGEVKMDTKIENKDMKTKIEVTDASFNELVIKQSKKVPIVVDFWATWCGPCVRLGPTLENFAKEYNGKFILAKLNVDENPIVSSSYGIMSIPSVKMFKDGKVADEFIGALPEQNVKEWLDKNL